MRFPGETRFVWFQSVPFKATEHEVQAVSKVQDFPEWDWNSYLYLP